MSPLCIRILLHYSWGATDYRRSEQEPHASSSAVSEALEWFVRQGLLSSRYGDLNWACHQAHLHLELNECEPLFSITDKGRAMVDHLQAVQIPICKWVQPERAP